MMDDLLAFDLQKQKKVMNFEIHMWNWPLNKVEWCHSYALLHF